MKVGLGRDHILLDGHPAPLPKRAQTPIFGPYWLWPNGGSIKMPLGAEVGLDPGDFVRWGPSPLPKKAGAEGGGTAPPMREVVGYFGYYSPDGDVAVRVITTVAKAALLVDNMEYGGKYESFTLLGATKDGCKIF